MKVISNLLRLVLMLVCLTGAAQATSYYTGTLNSAQEVPPNSSAAIGFGRVTLHDAETQIVASMNFSGLGSNQTASHIHGAASTGVNAPVLFNIGSTGAASGMFTDLFFHVTPAQALQLKTGQFYFNVHSARFPGGEIRGQIQRRRSTTLDFDGDSKTDFLIARRIGGVENPLDWYLAGSAGGISGVRLGSSSTARHLLGGDFNGDGRTDPAVWRDGTNGYLYYRASSANNPSGTFTAVQWGSDKDKPFAGDFDGDGKGDICISLQFTQGSNGIYHCLNSKEGIKVIRHGTIFHHIAPGDYDGDGKTDIGAVRFISNTTNGFKWTWHPRSSLDGSYKTVDWGASHGFPSQGDYDGDGKTDIAIWQAASGTVPNSPAAFYVVPSGGNSPFSFSWGQGGDVPINGYNVR